MYAFGGRRLTCLRAPAILGVDKSFEAMISYEDCWNANEDDDRAEEEEEEEEEEDDEDDDEEEEEDVNR